MSDNENTDREPYWFSKRDLQKLEMFFRETSSKDEVLEGIEQELAVAKARRDTHKAIDILTRALGFSKGAVPLYLTRTEVKYLQTIETLDPKLKNKLI